MDYINGPARGPGMTVQGLPLMKPPWGRITAIDLNRGEIVWQVPHGETPDSVKAHPGAAGNRHSAHGAAGSGRHPDDPDAAHLRRGRAAGGRRRLLTTPDGRRGAMLRAYDKATGENVGAVYMPAPQTGTPMTYLLGGRQYLVVAVGGRDVPAELLAFALP